MDKRQIRRDFLKIDKLVPPGKPPRPVKKRGRPIKWTTPRVPLYTRVDQKTKDRLIKDSVGGSVGEFLDKQYND
jgi:hypothetical protein